MATRIQGKSRVAKKVMQTAEFDLNGSVLTQGPGRKPRPDPRGYPLYAGLPTPVLVGLTVVDTTP